MRELELSASAIMKSRAYASFHEWPDKQVKELGIVEDLVQSLTEQGLALRNPRVNYWDPPDCVCRDASGNPVALEVVELVSQEAIERTEKGENVYRWWEPEDIRTGVAELLTRKDKKNFNGGPYADIAVVIHTDEPALSADKTREALAGVIFGPFEKLSKAFLIFSYMPGEGCQVLHLTMATHQNTLEPMPDK